MIGDLRELDFFRQMLLDICHHLHESRRVLLLSDDVFHLDRVAVRHAVHEVIKVRQRYRIVEFPDELISYVVGDHVEESRLYGCKTHFGSGAYGFVVHLLHRLAVAAAPVVERGRVFVILLRKGGYRFIIALCDRIEIQLLARVRKIYLIAPRSAEDHVRRSVFAHFPVLS